MSPSLLDNPLVLTILFHPRRDEPGFSRVDNAADGTIPVEEGIALGYRLYKHQPGQPVVVYFHGNGEIASDYDGIAQEYQRAGASLLVVDYRGYGWSTGRPLVSALLSDMGAVYEALPDILEGAGLAEGRLYVMGRSLGSACGIHLVHRHPDRFAGLIIESGFAYTIPLLTRLGLPDRLTGALRDPIGNVDKIREIGLPLLVIHGERDTLIPISNGEALYEASPAEDKRMVRIPRAGHNDLLYFGPGEYFSAIKEFINS